MKSYGGLFLSITAAVCLLSSCVQEEFPGPESHGPLSQPGRFRQTVTRCDGSSSVRLLVSSDSDSALAEFCQSVQMKALDSVPVFTSPAVTDSEAPWAGDDSWAVHVSVVHRDLAAGYESFSLTVSAPAARTSRYGTYSGAPVYFYSWEAPHYFEVTPHNGKCVSAWLYQAGSSWNYVSGAGGSAGNYLCAASWAAAGSVTTLDYRLKVQGADFSVYGY